VREIRNRLSRDLTVPGDDRMTDRMLQRHHNALIGRGQSTRATRPTACVPGTIVPGYNPPETFLCAPRVKSRAPLIKGQPAIIANGLSSTRDTGWALSRQRFEATLCCKSYRTVQRNSTIQTTEGANYGRPHVDFRNWAAFLQKL